MLQKEELHSNFNFLQNDWQGLAKIGKMAEYMLYKDPNTAIFKLRLFGEELINTMLKVENFSYDKNTLAVDKISILKRSGLIPADIENILTTLRRKGNLAAHGSYGDEQTADALLSLAVKLGAWFQEVYGTDYLFQSENIGYKKPENIDYEKEYQRLFERTDEIEKELENIKTMPHLASREDRKKLISKKKELEFTEEETRQIIDKQLTEAGWEANTKVLNHKLNKTLPEKKKNLAIAEWPCIKENGKKGFADYALFLGEKLYGILEAKRLNIDIPTALNVDSRIYAKGAEIFENAKLCDGSPFGEYKVPFLFSSNGRGYNKDLPEKSGILFLDARKEKNLPKVLKGFYSPKDLKELLEKDEDIANQKLKEESFEYLQSKIGLGLRYYQIDAIKSVEESLISGKRKVLLTMATGTGKTRTALGLIYRLLKTNKYKRILFVVDRTILGEQAKEAFDDVKLEQLLSLGGIYGVKGLNDKSADKDERVHIATVQSLIKRILYPSDDEKEKLTVGEYDCIIVDEAHRGYILDRNMKEEERDFFDEKDFESKYKAVIDYFDAVKIALTATPALHTQEIFGEPVYSYTCSQAVIDGYLVDAEPPYEIITKLSEEGIHYEKGAKVKVYDVETQSVKQREVLADELDFDIEKFNKNVITENFNREVCSALVDYINPEGPEKTLIFTASDEHADMVVRILREEYHKQGIYDMNTDMIAKMTGYVKDIEHLVKKFKNENYPTIAVTVDLLTTGIDVPKISNLVFLRKVKSRILYHQMLGRATRKCDEIDKTSYKVFDAVRNYADMKDFSDMNPVVNNPQIDMTKLLENYNKDASNEGKKYFVEQIVARLQRKKKRIKDLGEDKFEINSKIYRKNEEIKNIDSYIEYIKNINPDEIENEAEFLIFLDSIQSPKKERVISEHKDEIRSVKQIYGKNEKPEDYLESFKKYIRENQDKLEVLKLLKENPKEFKRKDLKELKYILDGEGYKETDLNSAYGKVKNVNITADILSYIKRVLKGSPIVDKEEKIQDIEKRIKRLNNWKPAQLKIIEKIISQLKENKYLTKEDFNTGIFKDVDGGYNKINQKLADKLEDILNIINEEIIVN